jgi:hypothetical protein
VPAVLSGTMQYVTLQERMNALQLGIVTDTVAKR